jgi:hypothetical protein
MAKCTTTGICHICGHDRDLSFEHVPPRKAFNDRRISVVMGRNCLDTNKHNLRDTRGEIRQKGLGHYTLCEKCNNDTGSWYGPAYVEWTFQGMRLKEQATGDCVDFTFRIYPLRVIKQIVCIFLSITKTSDLPRFRHDLARFVLNKDEKTMDSSMRILAYLNLTPVFRFSAVSFRLDMKNRRRCLFCDFAFPPYGYILTDNPDFDAELVDISSFSQYPYDLLTDVSLRLPIHPIETWMPGVFG